MDEIVFIKAEKPEKQEVEEPVVVEEVEVIDAPLETESDLIKFKPSLEETVKTNTEQTSEIDGRIATVKRVIDKLNKQMELMDEITLDTMTRIRDLKDPKAFKKRSQLQSIYMRQLEVQAQLIDAITKQESSLQTYIKMKRDVGNDYYRQYKIMHDIDKGDNQTNGLEELLLTINGLLTPNSTNNTKPKLVEMAEKELEDEEY